MDYSQFFETRTRQMTGEKFICLKDGVPQDLVDLIMDIHFRHFDGALPNDWIYKTVMEAFEELEDSAFMDIEIETDCYYSDLDKWFSYGFAKQLCGEAVEEGLCSSQKIWDIIAAGQWLAKSKIYASVDAFMERMEDEASAEIYEE